MKKTNVWLFVAALAVAGCASQDSAGKRGLMGDAAGRGLEVEALPEIAADIAVFPQLGHSNRVYSVAFISDGKQILSGLSAWDAETGRNIYQHRGGYGDVTYSPDGTQRVSETTDDTLKLWDAATGREIRTFSGGHAGTVNSVVFRPDGKTVLSGSNDGIVRLWDAATGTELARLIGFSSADAQIASATRGLTVETEATASSIEGEWLAITPEGYYQASPRGDRYLNVHVNNTVTGIDAYRSVLYNPDLVQARLQGMDELAALTGARGLEAGRASLTVTGNQKTLNFRLPLSLDPGPNRVEVVAFNGYAENRRSIDITRNAPAGEKPPLPGLWILAVGVNQYRDSRVRSLNYCANDAREIITLFKQQEGKRYAKVSSLLIADSGGQAPTAANIRGGLKFLEQAGPRDVILLFLAGHGISEGGAFYFLPGDAALLADGKTVDTDRAIPGGEITAVLEAPGNRLVFIDACQSGGVDSDRMVRSLMDTNAFVFTSSRGTELSQERAEYGHGVFTYSILQHITADAARQEERAAGAWDAPAFRGRADRSAASYRRPAASQRVFAGIQRLFHQRIGDHLARDRPVSCIT